MSKYYDGYYEERERLQSTNDINELLQVIDSLHGRDNLNFGDGIEQVRAEALRQLEIEYTDTFSADYQRAMHFAELGKEIMGARA